MNLAELIQTIQPWCTEANGLKLDESAGEPLIRVAGPGDRITVIEINADLPETFRLEHRANIPDEAAKLLPADSDGERVELIETQVRQLALARHGLLEAAISQRGKNLEVVFSHPLYADDLRIVDLVGAIREVTKAREILDASMENWKRAEEEMSRWQQELAKMEEEAKRDAEKNAENSP